MKFTQENTYFVIHCISTFRCLLQINNSFAWSKNQGERDLQQNFCLFYSGILTVERTLLSSLVIQLSTW